MADFAALAANAKKAPNVKNAVLLLKHMRAHKVRRSDLVVTYGGIALRNAKRLGDDAWAVYEQTLLAALDVDDQPLAKTCGDARTSEVWKHAKHTERSLSASAVPPDCSPLNSSTRTSSETSRPGPSENDDGWAGPGWVKT